MDPIRTTSFIITFERLCHLEGSTLRITPGASALEPSRWMGKATQCQTLMDVAFAVARYEVDPTYRKLEVIKVKTEVRSMLPVDETVHRVEVWTQARPNEFLGAAEALQPLLERARKVHAVEREFKQKRGALANAKLGAEEVQRCAKELLEAMTEYPMAAEAARDVGTHGASGMDWLEALPLGMQAFIDHLKPEIDAAQARLDDPLGETAAAIAAGDAEGGSDGD